MEYNSASDRANNFEFEITSPITREFTTRSPITNKNALSSVESRLLGDEFRCQRRRCCYATFSFEIQNECHMS